jgi:hypothetical protein
MPENNNPEDEIARRSSEFFTGTGADFTHLIDRLSVRLGNGTANDFGDHYLSRHTPVSNKYDVIRRADGRTIGLVEPNQNDSSTIQYTFFDRSGQGITQGGASPAALSQRIADHSERFPVAGSDSEATNYGLTSDSSTNSVTGESVPFGDLADLNRFSLLAHRHGYGSDMYGDGQMLAMHHPFHPHPLLTATRTSYARPGDSNGSAYEFTLRNPHTGETTLYGEDFLNNILNNTELHLTHYAASGTTPTTPAPSGRLNSEFSTGLGNSPESEERLRRAIAGEPTGSSEPSNTNIPDDGVNRDSWLGAANDAIRRTPSTISRPSVTTSSDVLNRRRSFLALGAARAGSPVRMVHPEDSEFQAWHEDEEPPYLDSYNTSHINRDDYEDDDDYDEAISEEQGEQDENNWDNIAADRKQNAHIDYQYDTTENFAPNGHHKDSVEGHASIKRSEAVDGPSNYDEGVEPIEGGKFYWRPQDSDFADDHTLDQAQTDFEEGNWDKFDGAGHHMYSEQSNSSHSGASADPDSRLYNPITDQDVVNNSSHAHQSAVVNAHLLAENAPISTTPSNESPRTVANLDSVPTAPNPDDFKNFGRYFAARSDTSRWFKAYQEAKDNPEDGNPMSADTIEKAKVAANLATRFGGFTKDGHHVLSDRNDESPIEQSGWDSLPAAPNSEDFSNESLPRTSERFTQARNAHNNLLSQLETGAVTPEEIPSRTASQWDSQGQHVMSDNFVPDNDNQKALRENQFEAWKGEDQARVNRRVTQRLSEWFDARFSTPITGIIPHNHVDGDEHNEEHIAHEASKAWVEGTAQQKYGIKMPLWRKPLTENEQDLKDRETLYGTLPIGVKRAKESNYGFLASHSHDDGGTLLSVYKTTPEGHLTGPAIGHHSWNTHSGRTGSLYGSEEDMPRLAAALGAWTVALNNHLGGVPLKGSTNTTKFSAAFMKFLPTTRKTLETRTSGGEDWASTSADDVYSPKCQLCFGKGKVPMQAEDLPKTPFGQLPEANQYVIDTRNRTKTQKDIELTKELLAGKSTAASKEVGKSIPPILDPETQEYLEQNKAEKTCPACNGSGDYNPNIRLDRDMSKIGKAGWANWDGRQWSPRMVGVGPSGTDWTHGTTPLAGLSAWNNVPLNDVTNTATAGVLRQLEAANPAKTEDESDPTQRATPVEPRGQDFDTTEDYENARYDYRSRDKRFLNFDAKTGFHVLSKSARRMANPDDPNSQLFLSEDDRTKANTDFFRVRHGLEPQFGGFNPSGTHVLSSPTIQPMRPVVPRGSTFGDERSKRLAQMDYDLVKSGNAPAHGGFALNGHHVLSQESRNPLTDSEKLIVTGQDQQQAEPIKPSQSSFDSIPEGLREGAVALANQDYTRVQNGFEPVNGGFDYFSGHHVTSDEGRGPAAVARGLGARRTLPGGHVPNFALSTTPLPDQALRDALVHGSSPELSGTPRVIVGSGMTAINPGLSSFNSSEEDDHELRSATILGGQTLDLGRQEAARRDFDYVSQPNSRYPFGVSGGFAPSGHHILSSESGLHPDQHETGHLFDPTDSSMEDDVPPTSGFESVRDENGNTINGLKQHPVTGEVALEGFVKRWRAHHDLIRVMHGLSPQYGGFAPNGHHVLSDEGESDMRDRVGGYEAPRLISSVVGTRTPDNALELPSRSRESSSTGIITMPIHPHSSTFATENDLSSSDNKRRAMEDYGRLLAGNRPIHGGFTSNGHHVLSDMASGNVATHYIRPQNPDEGSTFSESQAVQDYTGGRDSRQRHQEAVEDFNRVMQGDRPIHGGFSNANNGHHVLSDEHVYGNSPTRLDSSNVIAVNDIPE